MLRHRPKTISPTWPLDAPAMARMLSVDMVRSATTMYQMACQKRLGAGAESGGSLASTSTLKAIQTNEQAARQLHVAGCCRSARRHGGERHAQNHRGRRLRRPSRCAARGAAASAPPWRSPGRCRRPAAGRSARSRSTLIRNWPACHGAPRPAGRGRAAPRPDAPEIAPRHAHVFEDLRLQRLGVFEAALVADAFQERHADAARRWAFQRIEQEGLDGQLVARAESGAEADVGDGIPLAPALQDRACA